MFLDTQVSKDEVYGVKNCVFRNTQKDGRYGHETKVLALGEK